MANKNKRLTIQLIESENKSFTMTSSHVCVDKASSTAASIWSRMWLPTQQVVRYNRGTSLKRFRQYPLGSGIPKRVTASYSNNKSNEYRSKTYGEWNGTQVSILLQEIVNPFILGTRINFWDVGRACLTATSYRSLDTLRVDQFLGNRYNTIEFIANRNISIFSFFLPKNNLSGNLFWEMMEATEVGTVMAERAPLIRALLRDKKPSVKKVWWLFLSCWPWIMVPRRETICWKIKINYEKSDIKSNSNAVLPEVRNQMEVHIAL